MWARLSLIGAALLGIIAAILKSFKLGVKVEKGKQDEQTLESIDKAQEVENRINTDPDYAKRVRDHFKR